MGTADESWQISEEMGRMMIEMAKERESKAMEGKKIDEMKEENVIKEGFFWKQGKVCKDYRRRFFVLRESGVLEYFQNNRQKGSIDLQKYRLVSQQVHKSDKFYFQLLPNPPECRIWWFYCEEWVDICVRAISDSVRHHFINGQEQSVEFVRENDFLLSPCK